MRAYDEDGFYRRATEALSQTSDEAASTLTVALTECFPVRAANLYCYAPQVRHIVLRGCAGLDVTAFRSFEKDLNSTVAARAIDSGEIQIVDDIQAHPKFIEKGLASTYSLRAAIITPLAYTDGDADRPIVPLKGEERPHAYGVLTVFPDADAEGDRDVLADVMTRLGPFVAAACAASVRNDKVALRTELLGVAPGGRDLYSAFGAAIPRLAKKLCVEGCSIFLWDAASALLRLYGTTGLQSQLLPGDVH
ncbi:hypothetical protein HOK31_02590, partial [Candidatus Poribacteria bacterium]|nr:hypothetical protein [Candidatus Poribacteria bacterium]